MPSRRRTYSSRPGKNRPPMWAVVTVVLAGLAFAVWWGAINPMDAADFIGFLCGVVFVGAIAVFLLWMLGELAVAYVRNYRIAVPATALAALVGVVAMQTLSLQAIGIGLFLIVVVVIAFINILGA